MLDSLESFRGLVSFHIRDVKSKLDIDDILQDAAVDILKSGGHATPKNVIWTCKASRKKAWRDSRRDHVRLVTGENPNHEVHSDPLADMIRSEQIESLMSAMDSLDADSRTAIRMRYYENCTLKQIADSFGISINSASRIIRHALETIRESISE